MLRRLLLTCVLGFSVAFSTQAQFCGSKTPIEEIEERTDLTDQQKADMIAEQQHMEEMINKRAAQILREKDETVYVIPVVFHIFHKMGPENISEAQVRDCLRVMNEEFNGTNAKISSVHADFKSIIGDTKVEFRLASRDPQGNCTNGINRYYHQNPYFDSKSPCDSLKRIYIWPRDKYLNCFVVGSIESTGTGRTLGYATFPGGQANVDGLVMVHDGIGAIGTSNPTNQSVATHEIGHWLGLFHTWGNGACGNAANCGGNGDGVTDTPPTVGSCSTCDLNEATCGTRANVQNFMDYSFCYCMFTMGQSARMRSSLETVAVRKNLWQAANLTATGADYDPAFPPNNLCKADFMVSTVLPICKGKSVTYTDYSYGSVTSWNWSFPGGNPSTSTEQNPTVTYPNEGIYAATLTVGDGTNTITTTKNEILQVLPTDALPLPYIQPFANLSALSPDFTAVNPDKDKTWELKTGVGFDDSKCVYIQNRLVTGSGKADDLITNTFDLTNFNQPVIRFKYAYARKSTTSDDVLSIYVSTDCGQTWNLRKIIKGTTLKTGADTPGSVDYVPTANDWKSTEVALTNFKTSGVRVKFDWVNGSGNNLYLDNINIGEINVGVDELSSTGFNFGLYPNPTDQSANVSFELNEPSNTSVTLFDLLGKKVRTIQQGRISAGDHSLSIEKENLTPGIYFVKLRVDSQEFTKKLIFK